MTPDEEDLRVLADRHCIHIDDDDFDDIIAEIDDMLKGLDKLDLNATPTSEEFEWSSPDTNPYNSIRRQCVVPPNSAESSLLSGTEVGLKDNIPLAGVPMDCGSKMIGEYVPRRSARVVDRVRKHGAHITAKTNLDEFAGSVRGTTSGYGSIRNPHDTDRTAGGSSGGSAVAVATDRVDIALGTDTGGSVRVPASFCGIFGFKPTYGVVPLTGIIEHAYQLDHVGILSKSIHYIKDTLRAIGGPDKRDPASLITAHEVGEPVMDNIINEGRSPATGELTIGVLKEGMEGLERPVEDRMRVVIDKLEDEGAKTKSLSFDNFCLFKPVHKALGLGAVSDYWRANAIPYRRGGNVDIGFHELFTRRKFSDSCSLSIYYRAKLLAGLYLHSSEGALPYVYALRQRQSLTDEFDDFIDDVNCLLLPTVIGLPPKLVDVADPGYDNVRTTRPANVSGHPAISIPAGKENGLPVGVQLLTSRYDDGELLSLASIINEIIQDM